MSADGGSDHDFCAPTIHWLLFADHLRRSCVLRLRHCFCFSNFLRSSRCHDSLCIVLLLAWTRLGSSISLLRHGFFLFHCNNLSCSIRLGRSALIDLLILRYYSSILFRLLARSLILQKLADFVADCRKFNRWTHAQVWRRRTILVLFFGLRSRELFLLGRFRLIRLRIRFRGLLVRGCRILIFRSVKARLHRLCNMARKLHGRRCDNCLKFSLDLDFFISSR